MSGLDVRLQCGVFLKFGWVSKEKCDGISTGECHYPRLLLSLFNIGRASRTYRDKRGSRYCGKHLERRCASWKCGSRGFGDGDGTGTKARPPFAPSVIVLKYSGSWPVDYSPGPGTRRGSYDLGLVRSTPLLSAPWLNRLPTPKDVPERLAEPRRLSSCRGYLKPPQNNH